MLELIAFSHCYNQNRQSFLPKIGVANGKCETLRDDEINVFLREPETFWFLQLRDRDFKVF